jgi:Flp pilus assembly pilin Flp
MMRLFYKLLRNDDGATLLEYALVVMLVAIVAILAVTRLGAGTNNNLNSAAASI